MRFDEAFEILVDHCAAVSPALAAATGRNGSSARNSTYGNDVWITQVVQNYWASQGIGYMDLEPKHYLPFYDAAWELCRIGVLRPGHYAPMGQGEIGSGKFSGDGYSITEFGHMWFAKADRRMAGDPSRMAHLFASFADAYGRGFAQRANEAIRCHRTSNYLAACVMAGAAAESILLALAIAKTGDEQQVMKEYASAGGRGRVTKLVIQGLKAAVERTFEALLHVLHYWRDDAAHGRATTISEEEAYASLIQLLRLAQFCSDNWDKLTSKSQGDSK
jgi:hypothetical protein